MQELEEWEQMAKTKASKVIEEKLLVCNSAEKWWVKEVKKATRVRRKAPARYTSSKTTKGWEEYALARNKVEEAV